MSFLNPKTLYTVSEIFLKLLLLLALPKRNIDSNEYDPVLTHFLPKFSIFFPYNGFSNAFYKMNLIHTLTHDWFMLLSTHLKTYILCTNTNLNTKNLNYMKNSIIKHCSQCSSLRSLLSGSLWLSLEQSSSARKVNNTFLQTRRTEFCHNHIVIG